MEIINDAETKLTTSVSNGIVNGDQESGQTTLKDDTKITEYKVKTSVISSKPIPLPSGSVTNGDFLRKDVFYPYQKAHYISPSYTLSSDSKRMVRRLQDPMFSASPSTVHLVYEVG